MALVKNISNKIKKSSGKVIALLLFFVFNLTAIMGLVFAKNNEELLLASSIEPTKVSLSNPSFSSYSGSTPRTPTSWTKLVTDPTVISGVVDIDDADTKTESLKLKTDIAEYEGMSEDYVLLMNSPEKTAQMGYRSSEFTLDRNSHYVVSFKAYAENGTYGSAYLSSEAFNGREDNYFNITTPYEYEKDVKDEQGNVTGQETVKSATWKNCYFFVDTNKYFDTKATLDLRLGNALAGSKGAVLFDDIAIQKYAESDFKTLKNTLNGSNQCITHTLTLENYISEFSENFENSSLSNWEKVKDCDADNEKALNGHTYLGSALNEEDTGIFDNVSNQGIIYNGNIENKGALFINNTVNLSVGYKLKKDNYFNIEQNELYLLTFDCFTGTITGDGSAQAKIYAENSEGKYEVVATIDKISTSKAWKTYAFAINSNGFKDTNAYIEFSVEKAEGYAIFDNLELVKVKYEDYQKYLTNNSSTCKEADVSFIKTTSLNGYFNKTYNSGSMPANVYKVQKWTNSKYDASGNLLEEKDNTIAVSGIVNTNNWHFGFANPGNPNTDGYTTSANNILMMQNKAKAKQTMKSDSFTITSNKYYEVKIDVKTVGEAKAGIKVYNSNDKVIYEELFIINSDWTTHTINFVGAGSDTSVYFELSLGEDEALEGNAYFDNLITREITVSDTSKTYAQIFDNVNNNVVDLSKTNFANIDTLSKTNGIYVARDWKYTPKAIVNAGVVDTLNFGEVAKEFAVKNPGVPQQITNVNSKVFMIDSAFNTYYTATMDTNKQLDLNSYYKVSFWVLTQGIPQNNAKLDYNYGASIKVVDSKVKLGETFSGINTFGEWKEYTLYLNTLTNDKAVEKYNLNITLALGSEDLESLGTAFFSEIITTKIDKTEFDGVVKEQESTADDSIITFVGSTEPVEDTTSSEDDNTSSESSNNAGITFMYFSSILTAVVVLLAVIAFAVKSLKIKKPIRIKAADLNKERMSARNFAFKDKMIEINNRLAVLDDELFETNKAIDDLYYEKNTDPKKLEELKNKKAEIVQKMKETKQEENELVAQFKKFKKDERLRKNRSKNK